MDDINLLPNDFIARQQQRARLRVWLVTLAVTCVGLMGSWGALHWRPVAVERQVTALRQRYTELATHLDQLKGLRAQQQTLRAQEQIHHALLRQAPWQHIFFAIAALTDEEIWLSQLQLQKRPVAGGTHTAVPPQQRPEPFFTAGKAATAVTGQPESTRETASVLLVQGYATSTPRLANFMSGLSAAQYLVKVTLQEARRGLFLNREAIHFTIEIHL